MTSETTESFRVPTLIKRNTVLFALSQTFTGAGMQFTNSLGPLMVVSLSGSSALVGLPVGVVGLSRFLVAYPIGAITDRFGRKPGIQFGLVLALVGATVLGFSMSLQSFLVFIVGLTIFAMGMNAARQLRVAATDMFLPNHRAQALGYIAMGSLLGLVVAPFLITISESVALEWGQDRLGLPWFLVPAVIIPGMILISFVRPDPKEIGMNLGRYYPGYKPAPRRRSEDGSESTFQVSSLYHNVSTRLAIVANTAAQGNMSIVMVQTSLVLSDHGHSLSAIAFSHMFHTAGMFAFTIPLGRLADRIGREYVMYPGVAMALVGSSLVAFTGGFYWTVTLGTFLVGVGWAGANVAATALIADHVETHERGRAIGVADSFAGAMAVAMAMVIGPVIEWSGLPATGYVATLVAAVPLLMLILLRNKSGAQPPAQPDTVT